MTLSLLQEPVLSFEDNNGRPLSGGKLYTYAAGTLTPKATFQDQGGTIPNTNPITLNARGEATVYGSGNYRFILKDSKGNTIWDRDNVEASNFAANSLRDDLSNSTDMGLGVSLIGGAGRVVNTISDLRGLPGTGSKRAFVLGYNKPGDGGGGAYYLDKNDTGSADNGGTIIVAADGGRWKLSQAFPISVKQFGAKLDGETDDRERCQAALDYVGSKGGGEVYWPAGRCYIGGALLVWSGTKVYGAGPGATVMFHPASHCFKNKNYTTAGDSDIEVMGFTFDAGGTFDGGVSMVGVTRLWVHDNRFFNIKPSGVTVGIGIGASATATSSDITIEGNVMDCDDYCIVFDSSTVGVIQNVAVSNNHLTTHWGACVSLAKVVRNVTITGNTMYLPGDSVSNPQVGIGVKMWEGIDVNNAPADITITGNVFNGSAARTSLQAVSAANWTGHLVVSGNTFEQCTYALYNNFAGSGATNLTFSDNVVKNSDHGHFNDTSSDVEPVITGNTFRNILSHAIRSSLNHAVVANNKFADVAGKAIYANSPSEAAVITGNVAKNIGQEFFYMAGNSATNEVCSITNNTIEECCTSADNTYAVIQLNDQSHIVVGNMIRNNSTTVKPSWIIGSGAGDRRLITDNWMYGARNGYRQVAGAFDVYANNLERGGIG